MEDLIVAIIALVLSFFSVAVAVTSLIVTIRNARRTLKMSIVPVLVFTRDPDRGWLLKNHGNGPALDLVVYNGSGGQWQRRVNCFPLAREAEIDLPWAPHPGQLGATYNDAYGHAYTSIMKDDVTTITDGAKIETHLQVDRERLLRRSLSHNQKFEQ